MSIITNYTFDKVAKTVTFTDFSSIQLNRILSITDMSNGIQIYSYRTPQYLGTVATNVLTLVYDTNNERFSNTDKLYVEYITDNYGEKLTDGGAYITSFNSAATTNYGAKGAAFIINVTAITGTSTPTLTAKVQMQDVVSGNWVDIPGAITADITTTGQTLLTVYPGLTGVANSKVDFPLPRVYRLAYTITGATPSFTFSTGVHYLN